MAAAAELDELLGLVERVGEVLRAVHAQHRGELFVGKGFVEAYVRDLADEYLRSLGDIYAGELCDVWGGFADDVRVDAAVADDGGADLGYLVALEEVAAALFKFVTDLLVYFVKDDDGLL